MIDLHTHTTASDGRCSPETLVKRAHAAGVDVLSVTDHDTLSGCQAAAAACAAAGIEFVTGIEITSVVDDVDLHILGYFVDPNSVALHEFLSRQRLRRIERVGEMIIRLASLGIELNAAEILQPAADDPAKAAGRPWIARALVAGGYVADTSEAFDRWLARGRPAFIPRLGPSPEEVFAHIHEAGGVASLAHPVLVRRDKLIPAFAASGLAALEAYHSKHDGVTTGRYLSLARQLGLGVSGGSDYHGDTAHGPGAPGGVSLPREHYEQLVQLKPRSL